MRRNPTGKARGVSTRTALILIGHGAPATDCPPQLVGELMSLEWHADAHAARVPGTRGESTIPKKVPGARKRADELDAAIRDWPRHAGNDPYKAGLERVAETLRSLVPTELFAIGYNEFCRPSIAEAIERVIRQGATRVLVIPSMLTPGGLHSEVDIPRALEVVRRTRPDVAIEYLWPFDTSAVAALLAAHVNRALASSANTARTQKR